MRPRQGKKQSCHEKLEYKCSNLYPRKIGAFPPPSPDPDEATYEGGGLLCSPIDECVVRDFLEKLPRGVSLKRRGKKLHHHGLTVLKYNDVDTRDITASDPFYKFDRIVSEFCRVGLGCTAEAGRIFSTNSRVDEGRQQHVVDFSSNEQCLFV